MSCLPRLCRILPVAWLLLAPAAPTDAGQVWNHSVWGPTRAFTQGIETAKRILEKAGGGEFELKIHYGGSLAPPKEHLDGIQVGVIESATICSGYHPGKTPLLTVLELPFLLPPDLRTSAKVMDAVVRHPAIERELARRWNARYLTLAPVTRSELAGTRRVAAVADLEGARVRVPGTNGRALARFGAVPTMVTAPEVYTTLQRGTVDLVAFPYTDTMGVFRLHEVSDYITDGFAMNGFACFNLVSRDAWNALPPELRALSEEVRARAIQATAEANEAADARWIPEFKRHVELVPFPAAERQRLVESARPLWAEWAAEQDARGRPGTEVLAFTKATVARITGAEP